MKKQISAEQQAKREERKAKLRALATRVGKMTPQERAQLASTCPVMTIEGRCLSGFNQCMIALQMPAATVVGGFRQWIKAGRAVMKGQHGACIWVPIGSKATNKETGESETVEASRFILGTVFDVSQTQEIETANGAKLLAGENQGDLISSTQREDFALATESAIDGAAITAANEEREQAHAATLAQNLTLEFA